MRVRKLDANGDYQIGQGQANFWINSPEGVAQNVETRLAFWEGEWFLDKTIGTPYSQEILGYSTSSLRDIALKTVILGTDGVTELDSYNSSTNSETRAFTVQGTVVTIYSPTPVPFGPVEIL